MKDNQYSDTPTPYQVDCCHCGPVFLTKEEYNRQMNRPDSRWICPICWTEASWNDDNYEKYYLDNQ